MQKTILLTGSTDGIGLEAARMLLSLGHRVLLHGRNPAKLSAAEKNLSDDPGRGLMETCVADLSKMDEVEGLASEVRGKHDRIDVLINNAGVFHTPVTVTGDGLDIRFAVNTIAPYLLTRKLLPILAADGRIVNTSSAAQSPVEPDALLGRKSLSDFEAYAQSKLALNMWSSHMAAENPGPAVIAVNPGSMLGSKMVREGFGVDGGDIRIGARILTRAALDDDFSSASGQYFDNDAGRFAPPHADALDAEKNRKIVQLIENILSGLD